MPSSAWRMCSINRSEPNSPTPCWRTFSVRSPNPAPMMFLWSPAIAFALDLADHYRFEVIRDDSNLSETAAIEMATRTCEARGIQTTLVIPGDIPLIEASRHPCHLRRGARERNRTRSRLRPARDECCPPPPRRSFSVAFRQRQLHAAPRRGDCNSQNMCGVVAPAHRPRH